MLKAISESTINGVVRTSWICVLFICCSLVMIGAQSVAARSLNMGTTTISDVQRASMQELAAGFTRINGTYGPSMAQHLQLAQQRLVARDLNGFFSEMIAFREAGLRLTAPERQNVDALVANISSSVGTTPSSGGLSAAMACQVNCFLGGSCTLTACDPPNIPLCFCAIFFPVCICLCSPIDASAIPGGSPDMMTLADLSKLESVQAAIASAQSACQSGIPTLTEWGIFILVVLLAVSAALALKRRRVHLTV